MEKLFWIFWIFWIDDFGVSVAVRELCVRECILDFANIFLISKLSDNWWIKKKKWCLEMKFEKYIWLPISSPNLCNLLTVVVQTLQARSRRFIKVWSEIVSLCKMATVISILSNIFLKFREMFFWMFLLYHNFWLLHKRDYVPDTFLSVLWKLKMLFYSSHLWVTSSRQHLVNSFSLNFSIRN